MVSRKKPVKATTKPTAKKKAASAKKKASKTLKKVSKKTPPASQQKRTFSGRKHILSERKGMPPAKERLGGSSSHKTVAGSTPRTTLEQITKRQRSQSNAAEDRRSIRDIAVELPVDWIKPIDFEQINWERRMACKADPLLDLKTYFPKLFYLPWGDYHKELIHSIEDAMRYGDKRAFGVPRGGGKTGICRGMINRGTKYGMRKFAYFIGSKEPKAVQTLRYIRSAWFGSKELYQDFPEIAYPVYRAEGRGGINCISQMYKDYKTHLEWGVKEIHYPILMLDEEDAKGYLEHDPDSIVWLPDIGVDVPRFMTTNSGAVIRVEGIDGSIRGEAETNPVTLEQPRPDLVLLDDVQKEQKANSPKACQDLEDLIEAAVKFLEAPDVRQATLMPCTVIREDDVSDRFLNRDVKGEWGGIRRSMIEQYPTGMSDDAIYDEIGGQPNEVGKLWIEYKEVLEESYRAHHSLKLANEFYRKHRKIMDEGFKVSWDDRYKRNEKNPDPDRDEVSAIQSAMNLYFTDHNSFMSEAQNRPISKIDSVGVLLKPEEVQEKMSNIPRNELSLEWDIIVAFIDVQDEILFYTVLACDYNFNGQVIDYGTFPQVQTKYFRKSQTYGWSLLTRNYYKEHPDEKPAKVMKNRTTKARAPFDAKIHLALDQCCKWLFNRRFIKHDENFTQHGIQALAIDTKWGKSSDPIKKFVRQFNDNRIITYNGHPLLPSMLQLEEQQAQPGWLFEHQLHPHTKEARWVVKPTLNGGRFILSDVNRIKTSVMKHFATAKGSQGCITLFEAPASDHRMFADHCCLSEFPEPVTARGMTKDCWQTRPTTGADNDYFDCITGCIALASIMGASLKLPGHEEIKATSLKDAWKNRNSAASA